MSTTLSSHLLPPLPPSLSPSLLPSSPTSPPPLDSARNGREENNLEEGFVRIFAPPFGTSMMCAMSSGDRTALNDYFVVYVGKSLDGQSAEFVLYVHK